MPRRICLLVPAETKLTPQSARDSFILTVLLSIQAVLFTVFTLRAQLRGNCVCVRVCDGVGGGWLV